MSFHRNFFKKQLSIDTTSDTSIIISPNESELASLSKRPSARTPSSIVEERLLKKISLAKDKGIQEVNSESSSSVVLDDSNDIIVMDRTKPYGSRGNFRLKHGISLKKIRTSRNSDHINNKIPWLQIEKDVQPEIASVKSSVVLSDRERAESCYARFQHKPCKVNLLLISPKIIEFSKDCSEIPSPRESDRDDCVNLQSPENPKLESLKNEENVMETVENEEIIMELSRNSFNNDPREVLVSMIYQDNHEDIEPPVSSNSISSVVDINGQVFKYFDKSMLSQITVVKFCEGIKVLENVSLDPGHTYFAETFFDKICCLSHKLDPEKKLSLERLIGFCQSEFDFSSPSHLKILLGAYCSVTGKQDWPSNDSEWLNMGFSDTDLAEDLGSHGLAGLLYVFFISEYFPDVFKEMLNVDRRRSYEVFKACKYFAIDTIEIIKNRVLDKYFKHDEDPLRINFFFCTGMIIEWLSLTKKKDFQESYDLIISKAKKNPGLFLDIAGQVSNVN